MRKKSLIERLRMERHFDGRWYCKHPDKDRWIYLLDDYGRKSSEFPPEERAFVVRVLRDPELRWIKGELHADDIPKTFKHL
jgi:hypothetical protein